MRERILQRQKVSRQRSEALALINSQANQKMELALESAYQYHITEEVAQENLTLGLYNETLEEKPKRCVTNTSENMKKNTSKVMKSKRQKLKQQFRHLEVISSVATNRKIEICKTPVNASLYTQKVRSAVKSTSSNKNEENASMKNELSELHAYASFKQMQETPYSKTTSQLGLRLVQGGPEKSQTERVTVVSEFLGQQKQLNGKKSATSLNKKMPKLVKKTLSRRTQAFQAAKHELKIYKSEIIANSTDPMDRQSEQSNYKEKTNLMRQMQLQQSSMATNLSRQGMHTYPAYLQTQLEMVNREDRYGKEVKKTPSIHIPHPHLLFNPNSQERIEANLGAGSVASKTAKKKKTTNKIPLPEKVSYPQCSTPSMAKQSNQRNQWAATDSENGDYSSSGIYISTQQQNNMTYPQANESLRQNVQKPGPTATPFDLSLYNKQKLANQNRNNGRNTNFVVLESSGTGASIPRQIQDTGQPMSKIAPATSSVYMTPAKIAVQPDENPYMESNSDITSKPLARKPEVSRQTKANGHHASNQAPSAKTKYLNKPQDTTQIYSAQKSQKGLRSSSSIEHYNIFSNQKAGENSEKKIQQLPEQTRMPFEMASTFIQNSESQPSQNWLAQKMHNNVTAHQDLSRKSVNSFQTDQSDTFTGRSIETHNKPSSGMGDHKIGKAHHQSISAKIPAKVMLRNSAKGKESQWQSMQSVKIEPKITQNETRQQLQTIELSPASRLKRNMPIYSQPIREEGLFQQRSDVIVNEINYHNGMGLRQNLDTINITVNMQPSKSQLDAKRQSLPGPSLNTRANRPLATKYPVSGANGLNQKEPNKFPSSQMDNQLKYDQLQAVNKATVGSQYGRNNAQYLNRDKKESDYRQAEMSIDKDIQANHPLLSKSQSGVKKRPSMYNNSHQMFLSLENATADDYVMIEGGTPDLIHEKKQQKRSDSYFGRIQSFFGISKNEAVGDLDLTQKSKVKDAKREILSEKHQASPLHQGLVPKLTLKDQQNLEDFLPVSSQKFESPMATKQLSSHRFKCTCEPSSEPYACTSAFQWLQMANNGRNFEIQKSRKVYLDLLGIKDFISMAEERQIECDITRTFPQQQIFKEAQGEGQQALQRVLQAFSKYDACIGYVQGMNFIVGALLLHCSEEVTFWLFVALIEDYEMRDIYMEGLPGHIKHSTLITQLMEIHLADLYNHLQEIGMNIEIFATDWYFTLFAKVIPTSQMYAFFQNFFQFGWCFFHKFTLTLLRILAPQILQMDDMSEIKQLLLLPRHKQNFYGNNSSLTKFEETKSDSNKNPFMGSTDGNLDVISQQTQQRTFLSSIGNLFWPSSQSRQSSTVVDTQLQKLMGGASVEELLSKEDAWVEIIDISRNLWGTKLTDVAIKQFLNEYDAIQEKQKLLSMHHEAKFHDSQGRLSDAADYEKQGESDIVVMRSRDSNKTVKKQQSSNLAHKKKSSDSPLPQDASFSSNELDEDNLEYPTHELSPMKHVQDSGKRMPKQTKLMFKNIDSMRVMPQHTPRIDSHRHASDTPLKVADLSEQTKALPRWESNSVQGRGSPEWQRFGVTKRAKRKNDETAAATPGTLGPKNKIILEERRHNPARIFCENNYVHIVHNKDQSIQ